MPLSMPLSTPRRADAGQSWLWIVLLAAASIVLSSKLACATPFAALATLAALHMKRAEGLALTALVWAANQIAGYTMLGYPHQIESYAWGLAIGAAAFAGFVAPQAVAPRLALLGRPATIAAALAASFAAYEIVLFAATAILPAGEGAFSWTVVGQIALINAVALPALMFAHQAAATTGLTGARHAPA